MAKTEGVATTRAAAGRREKMDCSKVRVKSKLSRQPATTGPKALSAAGEQVMGSEWLLSIV